MSLSTTLTIRFDIDPARIGPFLAEHGPGLQRTLPQVLSEFLCAELERSVRMVVEDEDIVAIKVKEESRTGPCSIREAAESGGIEFWYAHVQVDLAPGARFTSVDVTDPVHLRLKPIQFGNGPRTFEFSHKPMKTRERHVIKLHYLTIPAECFAPLAPSAKDCQCPTASLTPVDIGTWHWWQPFACAECGKRYLCECFRPAVEKFTPNAAEQAGVLLGGRLAASVLRDRTRDRLSQVHMPPLHR